MYVIPQYFYFPELIEGFFVHYSNETRDVVTHNFSQIFITITSEEIITMLGLHSTNFLEKNNVPLSEETLVHNFTSLSPQEQFSCVHGIQKQESLLQVLNSL